ncbi:MAG: phosphate regulon sensor histidine kinase PhoR [Steroidobacteraceae bacterium]
MPLPHWWSLTVRLLIPLALGVVVGLIIGSVWLGVALGLCVALVLQLINLIRTIRWLRGDDVEAAPDFPGLWGDLIAMVVRLYRRKQRHKTRLLRLLRELRRSTSALPDGVVVLTPQAEILWFNPMAARMLGFRGKGDVGLRIDNLVRQPEFQRYLRQAEYQNSVTIRNGVDGSQFLSLQIVPYGSGQQLLLVRDMTQPARLEAMRRDFVANASHELRSPLTVISGYLETLAQEPGLDPDLAGPLAEMRRQAQRMTGIIEDLLELSRLENSERAQRGAPVDVTGLLAQLRKDALARPRHPARVEVLASAGAQLLGEEREIHSAFGNLVDNAVKYTPQSGSITLRWWTDRSGGHFSVSDTGPGIAAEHLPRLTERFYRVDPGRSRASGGSGLGLSIVKHVLQRHGAWLQIESREGQGSTFTCHFPPERVLVQGSAAAANTANAG